MPRTRSPKPEELREKKPRHKPVLQELGSNGANPFDLFSSEDAYDDSKVSIEDLETMLQKDGQAMSLYRVLTMPIRAGELRVTPAKGGQAEADFIRTQLTAPPELGGMKTPWPVYIAAAAKAILTGTEITEKCFDIRNGWLVIDKLAPRPRTSYRIKKTKKGEFKSIVQTLPGGEVTIPANKLLKYTVNREFNPLYGQSMMLPAYYHYQMKHKLYYVAHLAYALNAIPIREGTPPPNYNDAEFNAFKKALDNIGVNTSIIVPDGYSFKVHEGRTVADSLPLINHHDISMSKAVLSQLVDLGTTSGSGSYALGEQHMELLLVMTQAMRFDIANLINSELIPELIDWNFGSTKYPRIELLPAYTDVRSAVKEIFEHISGAKQVNFSAEFMFELEKSMAEILGFADDIGYEAKQEQMVKDSNERQKIASGQEVSALDKEKLKNETEKIKVSKIAANKPVVAAPGANRKPTSTAKPKKTATARR